MATDELVSALRQHLAATGEGIVAAYLFGSHARGAARHASDLDVAVLLRGDPPRTLAELPLDLASELEQNTGLPVDLVVLNDAPADLVHRVLRDGVLLLDRDRSLRLRFEVAMRNRFFDLQPVLRRYRGQRATAP